MSKQEDDKNWWHEFRQNRWWHGFRVGAFFAGFVAGAIKGDWRLIVFFGFWLIFTIMDALHVMRNARNARRR
jgi:hypothetical protein